MSRIALTTSNDTVVSSAPDLVVDATATTLNSGDQLTAGGTGTLTLDGSGTFRVDALATFSGFSRIVLDSYTNDPSYLYLGNQSVMVVGGGTGDKTIYLGSGQTTYGGALGSNSSVISRTSFDWNSANEIDGFNGGGYLKDENLTLNLNWSGEGNVSYDLTSNTFHNITSLYGAGNNLTLQISSATVSGVSHFYGSGIGANDRLVTSDSTLDLSHSTVAGFSVASTNSTGTTFTVQDLATAFTISGGSGQDTIVATGFNFTADQRNAIFDTASIEKIIDSTGTYTALPPVANLYKLTTGNDTVGSSSPHLVVDATAATLNYGDQLRADGTGTLNLYGSGNFLVSELDAFSGFSDIVLNNTPNDGAYLYLGNQSVAVTGLGSGDKIIILGGGQTTYKEGVFESSNTAIVSGNSSDWNAANEFDGGNNAYLMLNQSARARLAPMT
jgi:hypothetical protein